MNGYKLMANSYRKLLENQTMDKESKNNIKQEIKVMDTLATFEKGDKYIAFDSGMFNDIFKGYVKLLTEDIDEDTKKLLRERSRGILEEYNSKTAEDKYLCK